MAPQTITEAIKNTLENLSKNDFEKFCSQLLDRREEPRVRRNKVEGKNYLAITDVLVNTFTEAGVFEVVSEILKRIECFNDEKDLAADIRALSNPGASGNKGPSGEANSRNIVIEAEHFVDKHRIQLIKRLKNINPILDELLARRIIQQEEYESIRAETLNQEKVRMLYDGPLQAGIKTKDAFYEILEENAPYLVDDLKKE